MQTGLDRFVILLNCGIAQRRLYFAEHPKMRIYSSDLTDTLHGLLAETQQDTLFIGVVDGKFVYNGRYLVGSSIAGRQLIDFVQNLHGGGLSFGRLATSEELQALLSLATELHEPTHDLEEGRELLVSRGITNIELVPHYADPSDLLAEDEQVAWQGQGASGDDLQSPVMVYQALFDLLAEVHGNAANDRSLDLDRVRTLSEHLVRFSRSNFMDMMQLVRYPNPDSYTLGHSVRVATLAVHVGGALGASDEHLVEVGTAGLLHDVGKSKIPDQILYEPGQLQEAEYEILQSHTRLGAEILLEHNRSTPMQVAAAWGHHLRHDGGGYPDHPAWAVRHPVTALIQICDVFEALTAVRPYKPPLTPRAAYEIMLKDEGAFDPGLLTAFVSAMGLYPPGNQVRLSDGSLAIVLSAGDDIAKPVVRIMSEATGPPLPHSQQRVIDLAMGSPEKLAVIDLVMD